MLYVSLTYTQITNVRFIEIQSFNVDILSIEVIMSLRIFGGRVIAD